MSNNKFERLLAKNSPLLTRGHDFVEIGGIKWATCNVGAEKPTDPGLYFAWGETKGYTAEEIHQGKHSFNYENYEKSFLKNNNKDIVRANWGGAWRMPTVRECRILANCAFSQWTNNYNGSGKAGMILTSKENFDNVLFFPALGVASGRIVHNVNHGSRYLIKGHVPKISYEHVNNMYFYCYGSSMWVGDYAPFLGCQVRGVLGY